MCLDRPLRSGLAIYLSIYLSIDLSIYRSICLPIYLQIYLSVNLSTFFLFRSGMSLFGHDAFLIGSDVRMFGNDTSLRRAQFSPTVGMSAITHWPDFRNMSSSDVHPVQH